jgi:hypothetical protein
VTPAGRGIKETTMTEQSDAFLTAWTAAEQAGDVRTLDVIHLSVIAGAGGAPALPGPAPQTGPDVPQ